MGIRFQNQNAGIVGYTPTAEDFRHGPLAVTSPQHVPQGPGRPDPLIPIHQLLQFAVLPGPDTVNYAPMQGKLTVPPKRGIY